MTTIDGVSKIFIVEHRHGSMHIDGHKEPLSVIDRMVRRLMLEDDSKASRQRVIAVVERALLHMEDPTDALSEQRRCHKLWSQLEQLEREKDGGS